MTHDLDCRQHGRLVSSTKVGWCFLVSDGEWIAVGFEANDDADVGGYQRCQSYRLETSAAQALVWLADDVQEQLNGQEFVQWPSPVNTSWLHASSTVRRYGWNPVRTP